jgi:hypothetical protein
VGGTSVLDGMRLSGMPTYPSIGTDFERTFRTLKELPCDIFLGAHASYFDGRAKAARLRSNPDGPNPFVDPGLPRLRRAGGSAVPGVASGTAAVQALLLPVIYRARSSVG